MKILKVFYDDTIRLKQCDDRLQLEVYDPMGEIKYPYAVKLKNDIWKIYEYTKDGITLFGEYPGSNFSYVLESFKLLVDSYKESTYNIWFCEYFGTLEDDNCTLNYKKLLYEDIKGSELQNYAKTICKEYDCDDSNTVILGKYVTLNWGAFVNDKYCLFFEEVDDSE